MYINNRKKKRRLSKKAILLLTGILAVLAVLITGLVMLLTKGREVKDTLAELPFDSEAAYFRVGSTIVYSKGDLLTCVDASLNTVWQAAMYTSGLKFTASDNIIVATSDTVIQAVDEKGVLLFQGEIPDGVILSARAGRDKVAVSVIQQLADSTLSYIIVFDSGGNKLYELSTTGRNILDYGFDAQSSQLYLLELDADGAAPVSRISTYRPETQSMTGINDLKDQLVSGVYITNDKIYAMGTGYLTTFTALKQTQKRLVYGWAVEDISTLTDTPIFVYVQSAEMDSALSSVRVIRASGDEIKINLPPGVFSVLHTGEKIYCFASDRIFVYTVEGKYQRTHLLPLEIDGVQKAVSGYAFLTAGKAIYLLPLP